MKYIYWLAAAFIFGNFAFIAVMCSKAAPINPPTDQSQWFCQSIADLQTDPNDSLEVSQRAVAYKDKFWPVGYAFKVGFIGTASTAQTNLFRQCANEWAQSANVKFTYPAAGPYDLLISFYSGDGAWSYIGTDCKSIAQGQATMNLGWLAKDAYLHEIGHTLGLLHEHQQPNQPIKWNEANVIKDLSGPPNNWTLDMIRYNVLNPYPLPNVITTALDAKSIMMYPIPLSWTLDGFSTPGGEVISEVDKKFIGERYPFSKPPTKGNVTLRKGQIDTLISEMDARLKTFEQGTADLKKSNDLMRKYLGRN